MMFKKLLITILLTASLSGCWDIDTGEKIGNVIKVSKKGYIIGTWEVELIKGGMNNGNGSFGKSFYFTVESKDKLDSLNKLFHENKEVKVKYHKELIVFPWRSEGDTFLDEVEIVK